MIVISHLANHPPLIPPSYRGTGKLQFGVVTPNPPSNAARDFSSALLVPCVPPARPPRSRLLAFVFAPSFLALSFSLTFASALRFFQCPIIIFFRIFFIATRTGFRSSFLFQLAAFFGSQFRFILAILTVFTCHILSDHFLSIDWIRT